MDKIEAHDTKRISKKMMGPSVVECHLTTDGKIQDRAAELRLILHLVWRCKIHSVSNHAYAFLIALLAASSNYSGSFDRFLRVLHWFHHRCGCIQKIADRKVIWFKIRGSKWLFLSYMDVFHLTLPR